MRYGIFIDGAVRGQSSTMALGWGESIK